MQSEDLEKLSTAAEQQGKATDAVYFRLVKIESFTIH